MVDSSEEGKLREGHSFCWFERELEETERPAKMSRTLLGGELQGRLVNPQVHSKVGRFVSIHARGQSNLGGL